MDLDDISEPDSVDMAMLQFDPLPNDLQREWTVCSEEVNPSILYEDG